MGHLRDVVAPNVGKSLAVLVASTQPCIRLAFDEAAAARTRPFKVTTPQHLESLALPRSWIMAAIVCPGDSVEEVAAWTLRNGHDADRVHFYYHPDVDARGALAAWERAGFRLRHTWPASRWNDIHPHLGRAWNAVVHDDHCRARDCPLR